VPVRLEPADEYLHELGPEPNFNESMYFNVYDRNERVGGFFRLGNRANEGYAEMTVCLYLPDGRVGFMYARPPITDNTAFDAGGLRFRVVEPFEQLEVRYGGELLVLDDPSVLADPRRAFAESLRAPADVVLTYTRVSDMFGGEPEVSHEAPGEEFARGHYEQLNAARGIIQVGGMDWTVSGHGLRDHSWGPRQWQAPWYYRWLTANFDGDFGFMASRVARRDSDGTRGGFVWDGQRLRLCREVEIHTIERSDDLQHRLIEVRLSDGDGSTWEITGRVMNMVPLRNRRRTPEGEELMTRISEGLTEWTLDDGRVGYGLSEYLDQIVDGRPVGLAE
jgi:hypothetical protein